MRFLASTFFTSTSAAIVLAALLPTAGVAQQVAVTSEKGELALTEVPRKVAVFDLASLDNLNALGVTAIAGIAKADDGPTVLPAGLEQYAKPEYAAVGTLFEPNAEALKALGPDLIIVGGRSRKSFEAVSAIAPALDMTPSGSDIAASTIENTRRLGKLFDVEDRAETRIREFETALGALREQGGQAGKGLVLFAAGKGYSAQAPGSRFGTVYDFVGIPSVLPPAPPSAGGPRPEPGSPEAEAARKLQAEQLAAALAAEPDWLFVLDRNAAVGTEPSDLAQRLAADDQIAGSKAWKDGNVIYLDAKSWYLVGAGIDAMTSSAKALTTALAASN